MQNILFILALILVGKLCSLLKAFPPDSDRALSQFVIHVSLPALILVQMHKMVFDTHVLAPILMPWLLLLFSAIVVLLVSRVFRWSRQTTGALLLVVPLGNTSFLGIPMVELFLGPECVPYAVVYDQLGTFLALATYGTVVVAMFTSDGAAKAKPAAIVRRVLTFPPLLALVLAAALRGVSIPDPLTAALQRLADTLIPVAMVAVGFQLKVRLPRRTIAPLSFGLGVKMVAAPLVALGVAFAFGAHHPAMNTAVLEAGMPPQISAGAVAIAAGLEPELVGAMVGLGIILSPATLWVVNAMV